MSNSLIEVSREKFPSSKYTSSMGLFFFDENENERERDGGREKKKSRANFAVSVKYITCKCGKRSVTYGDKYAKRTKDY